MKKILLWLGWLALLTLTIFWRLKNIDAFGLNNDEGAYLMWARLVSEGYPLYSQTYTNAPPLFIEMLALAFRISGFGVVLGRLVVLAHFVVLVGMLSCLSHRIAAWPGAYASLLMAAVLPPMFSFSRQVMLEIPAMTFAVAAVLCAFLAGGPVSRRAGEQVSREVSKMKYTCPPAHPPTGPPALFLSGVFLAASLLIKFLHPLVVAPAAVFICYGTETLKWRFWRAFVFGLAVAATMLVVFLFFDLNALLDQVFRFRMETRSALSMQLPSNWQRFTAYIGQMWGLGLLTLAGIIVSVRSARGLAWTLWLAANFTLLMWYDPVFPHHFTIILPSLILLAVEFIGWLVRTTKIQNRKSKIVNRLAWGLLVLALFNLPAMVKANQAVAAITTGGREAEAAQILAQVTRPADFVMSDSQLLALTADRLTPPPLVDFSMVTIESGRQTPERLIAISEEYAVAAVAPWSLRMVWLPEYIAWADEYFLVHKVWDNDHQLYFGPKHPPDAPIPNARLTQFKDGVSLAGYSVNEAGERVSRRAGGQQNILSLSHLRTRSPAHLLPISLYWQTDEPLSTNYIIFVQLIDPDGQLVAQNDSQPIYGYYPTSQWPPGEIIPDRITIELPENLSPGDYTLIAGLYDGNTLTRLPLRDGKGDYAVLDVVTIE